MRQNHKSLVPEWVQTNLARMQPSKTDIVKSLAGCTSFTFLAVAALTESFEAQSRAWWFLGAICAAMAILMSAAVAFGIRRQLEHAAARRWLSKAWEKVVGSPWDPSFDRLGIDCALGALFRSGGSQHFEFARDCAALLVDPHIRSDVAKIEFWHFYDD